MGWGLTFIGLEMQKLILPVRVVVRRENVSVPNPHPTSFTLLLFLESKSDSCLFC